MMRALASVLLSQAGWLAVATLAARGRSQAALATGALVAVTIVLLSRRRARTAVFAAGAAALGPLADLPLVRAGLVNLRDPLLLDAVMPLWWWGLWAMFAAALPAAFGWLQGRPVLGALIGAVGGPAAYLAGAVIGAISLRPNIWTSLVAIGAVWGLVLPLAIHVASLVVPPSGARP